MKIKQRISIFSQQNPLKPLISIIKKKEIVKKFEKIITDYSIFSHSPDFNKLHGSK